MVGYVRLGHGGFRLIVIPTRARADICENADLNNSSRDNTASQDAEVIVTNVMTLGRVVRKVQIGEKETKGMQWGLKQVSARPEELYAVSPGLCGAGTIAGRHITILAVRHKQSSCQTEGIRHRPSRCARKEDACARY